MLSSERDKKEPRAFVRCPGCREYATPRVTPSPQPRNSPTPTEVCQPLTFQSPFFSRQPRKPRGEVVGAPQLPRAPGGRLDWETGTRSVVSRKQPKEVWWGVVGWWTGSWSGFVGGRFNKSHAVRVRSSWSRVVCSQPIQYFTELEVCEVLVDSCGENTLIQANNPSNTSTTPV